MAGVSMPLLIRSHWCCQGSLNAPFASMNTLTNCSSFNTSNDRQLSKRQRLTIIRIQNILSSIPTLLLNCGPSDITRFVISIFVRIPIQRMTFRTWPHILKEILKGQPSITNTNPTTTVFMVTMILWITTTLPHITPGSIFNTDRAYTRMSMFIVHDGSIAYF